MEGLTLACAGLGLGLGIFFGRYQLRRWMLISRGTMVFFAVACTVIFGTGYWFMALYEYHLLKMIRYWLLMYGLLLLAFFDARKKIIPNRALLAMVGTRTVLLIGECVCFPELCFEIIVSALIGLAGGGLLFLLPGILMKKGIGMGDVKLIGVVGYYLGFQVLMSSLIITLTLTVLTGVAALIAKKASPHSEIPFAPFVAVGTIITILMGC